MTSITLCQQSSSLALHVFIAQHAGSRFLVVPAACSAMLLSTRAPSSGAAVAMSVDTGKAGLLQVIEQADKTVWPSHARGGADEIEALEALNPTPNPLEAPDLLSGCWRLIFTTSDSILGVNRPRPFRPRPRILQSIDASKLAAKNEEWVLRGLLKNSVRADLTPRDDGRTVDVQFKKFGIGWLRIPAPLAAACSGDFLDDSLRSRAVIRKPLRARARWTVPRVT